MDEARIAALASRGVVRVSGAEARTLLHNVVTADIDRVVDGAAAYGSLLTPQGKILFDFLIASDDEGYLVELPRAMAADFVRRLTFYRLRARVEVTDISDGRTVLAAWGGDHRPAAPGAVFSDPRLPELGWRIIAAAPTIDPSNVTGFSPASEADWQAHRIHLGVPEGGLDFVYGETFPHDADLDQLHGIDFAKGCYVGQEVVSRMEHRGTARRRIVSVTATSAMPPAGTLVSAGGRPIGALGSSSGHSGLALVRLDRAKAARDRGETIAADDVPIVLSIPAWARFRWPESAAED